MSLLPFGRKRYEDRQRRTEQLADAYRTGIDHGREIERSSQSWLREADEEILEGLRELLREQPHG